VERLDLRELEAVYSEAGHPAYHAALQLKVWLYAYALGITSSRRLEQRIREDLAFRYLAGGAQQGERYTDDGKPWRNRS
jgi:transposase